MLLRHCVCVCLCRLSLRMLPSCSYALFCPLIRTLPVSPSPPPLQDDGLAANELLLRVLWSVLRRPRLADRNHRILRLIHIRVPHLPQHQGGLMSGPISPAHPLTQRNEEHRVVQSSIFKGSDYMRRKNRVTGLQHAGTHKGPWINDSYRLKRFRAEVPARMPTHETLNGAIQTVRYDPPSLLSGV